MGLFGSKNFEVRDGCLHDLDARTAFTIADTTSVKAYSKSNDLFYGAAGAVAVLCLLFGAYGAAVLAAAVAVIAWKFVTHGVLEHSVGGETRYFHMPLDTARALKDKIESGMRAAAAADEEKIDVEAVDTGTPQERYDRAIELWDSKVSPRQHAALKIIDRLVEERVEDVRPYTFLSSVLSISDMRGNIDRYVDLLRRVVEIEPDNQKHRDRLELGLFLKGKLRWDDERNDEAFDAYIEGLEVYTASGKVLDNDAPKEARIAFRFCRMFAKAKLEDDGDTSVGVRFLDWCENAGLDMTEPIDISDVASQ